MRHGEVYNPKKVIYGRLPRFPITKIAKVGIKKLVPYFKRNKINIIYSSPLLRTRQSAEIIAKGLGLKVKYNSKIIEIKLFCEGMSLEKFKKEIQPYLFDKKFKNKGQEQVEDIRKRMLAFLNSIEKRHKNKNILVISHGDPIVILKACIENKDFTFLYKKQNYIQTADFLVLEKAFLQDKWKIIRKN
jgi:isoleucyl-tRNA synthetase